MMIRHLLTGTVLLCCSQAILAASAPFETCPSKAFLIQGAIPKTYAVNLVTGDYDIAQDDMGTKAGINAVGFNPNDGFMYGWNYADKKPGRIGNDFKIESLSDVANPTAQNFFVGDISILENAYYVYNSGVSSGLYRISLDQNNANYHKMVRVVDGKTLNLTIYDIAFHPSNGLAYSVDNKGDLYQINATSGTATKLGATGVSGTFGAIYFDVNGHLYFSRNNDGKVFSVDINSAKYTAVLFAQGPSSSSNDGARCALADVVDNADSNIDFGDAPSSYGTSLQDNGARHGLKSPATLFLGTSVDGESDATPFPMSDDETGDSDDEDGIQFATNLTAGSSAVVMVKASTSGNLSAWIDTNQNGQFDADEQVMTDQPVTAGLKPLYIKIPAGATPGATWARFRLSSATGLEPTGGAPDGEVEDYKVDIRANSSNVTYYPSSTGWATVAFEDNWPFEGDYDMNDMVTYLRTAVYRTEGKITQVNISGQLAAVGAAYHNGFGIRLPGILRSQIDESKVQYTVNDRDWAPYNPLETGRNEAIFIPTYNVWNYVSAGENCTYYRTQSGCGSDVQMTFNLVIPFKEPIESNLAGLFDPFMFATPGAYHGSFFDQPPGRSYEIHLKNQAPTEAFNTALMNGAGADASDPSNNLYFLTKNGMPWAMEMGNRWQYPLEYHDLILGYQKFPNYVATQGSQDANWFDDTKSTPAHLFKD